MDSCPTCVIVIIGFYDSWLSGSSYKGNHHEGSCVVIWVPFHNLWCGLHVVISVQFLFLL